MFYTHVKRAFRTTLIGNLYEVAQVFPVVLLAEETDNETERALADKNLFPKLEKIVPVRQFNFSKKGQWLKKNKYAFEKAKEAIENYKPDVLVLSSDMQTLFELYLCRFAKKQGARIFSLQYLISLDRDSMQKWTDLLNAYGLFPNFLPVWLRVFLVKCRKYAGHFYVHWFLPLTVGQMPFFGKSSFILRNGIHGMRDATYQAVFDEREYKVYEKIYLKKNVPLQKLVILNNPLLRDTRKIFEKIYSLNTEYKGKSQQEKIITVTLPPKEDLGFDKRTLKLLIDGEQREKDWHKITEIITRTLPGWNIYIKPHPDTLDDQAKKADFEKISPKIKYINPKEAVDKYIEMADIVIGYPMAASSTLSTTVHMRPGKPVIAINFKDELLGDTYKDFPEVEYVENEDELVKLLLKIERGQYAQKKPLQVLPENLKKVEFADTAKMIEKLCVPKNNEE